MPKSSLVASFDLLFWSSSAYLLLSKYLFLFKCLCEKRSHFLTIPTWAKSRYYEAGITKAVATLNSSLAKVVNFLKASKKLLLQINFIRNENTVLQWILFSTFLFLINNQMLLLCAMSPEWESCTKCVNIE